MRIYGAGMAGLLAANLLRRHCPIIHEAAESLPNNHAALLRFRTDAVSRATGIPFRKVCVQKGIIFDNKLHTETNLRFNNLYSEKVTGKVVDRSILNLSPSERFIAPPDFIIQLARSCNIVYNSPLTEESAKSRDGIGTGHETYISTIPMPALMTMLGVPYPEQFRNRPITSIIADLHDEDYDVYQTLYFPEPKDNVYRASMVGSQIILEMMGDERDNASALQYAEINVRSTLEHFGIDPPAIFSITHKTQKYGKILPIDDAARKSFILQASDRFNIYSVGRFATWRQILLDDVVKDVEMVAQFINQRDLYGRRLRGETV